MDIRNNKGITLMAEVMTVLLLLMIISIISYSSMSSLQVRNLNNMYSDIVSIQEKAANYFLKYGKVPVTSEAVASSVVNKMTEENQNNPNDGAEYYKIDFSALANMSLNNKETTDNYYYMNTKTLTVYYSKGVTIDNITVNSTTGEKGNKVYYTLPSNYTNRTAVAYGNYQETN